MQSSTSRVEIFMHSSVRAEVQFTYSRSPSQQMTAGLRAMLNAPRSMAYSQFFDFGLDAPVLAVPRDGEEHICAAGMPRYAVMSESGEHRCVVFLYDRELDGKSVLLAVAGPADGLLALMMTGLVNDDRMSWSETYASATFGGDEFACIYSGCGKAEAGGATNVNGKLYLRATRTDDAGRHPAYRVDEFEEEHASRHRIETQDAWVRSARVSSHLVFFEGMGHSEAVYSRKLTPEMRRLAPWLLTSKAAGLSKTPIDLGLDAPVLVETSSFRREEARVGRMPKHIVVIKHGELEAVVFLTPVNHGVMGKAYLASVLSAHEAKRELALRCRGDFSAEHQAVRGEAKYGDATVYCDRSSAFTYINFAVGVCAVQYQDVNLASGVADYLATVPQWLLDAYVRKPDLLTVSCSDIVGA